MMKRSVVVIGIGICLSVALCMYGVVANARKDAKDANARKSVNNTSTSNADLRLPAITSFGEKG